MHRFGICAQGLLLVTFLAGASAIHGWTQKERARVILSKELPELNGKHLKGTFGRSNLQTPASPHCRIVILARSSFTCSKELCEPR